MSSLFATLGKTPDLLRVAAFALLLAVAPRLLGNDYYVSVMTLSALNAIIALGLSLLLGYAGQISLGHAAFFGIGAYGAAIASATWGWPVWAADLFAVLLTAAVALVIGWPTLKLKGHYLAMATLGFGVIVYIVLNETVELTGGPSGFTGVPKFSAFGRTLADDRDYYALSAGLLCLLLVVAFNLIRSRTGRALRALHVSEQAARAVGVDVSSHKLFVFTLSAVFAGLAGVVYAHYLGFVAPASFGFHFSVQLITMVVLGGMGSAWGAIFGAYFLTSLPEFLRVFEHIDILVYGAILTLCMMFLPEGLAGGLSMSREWLAERLTRNKESRP